QRVARRDGDEAAILRGALEMRRIEDGMVRLRQAAEDEKGREADINGRKGANLPGARHESGPAVERSAADIERIEDHGDRVLHEEAETESCERGGEHDQRQ